ncbi:hypothetical protein HN682_02600 [Candidatus Peregrinibacteria bacterium]|jgi:glutathione synthase/RimK-type ligase-like ATP-grasp enzyme|nr:hypothetical protein [Candidatus Peregrinibacteria bacterium]
MKKTIAIYFSEPEPMADPFHKLQYLEKYKEIISAVEAQNVTVYIVRGDSYVGEGRFTHGWKFVGDKLVDTEGEVKADLIFNRDNKNTIPVINDCSIINKPAFDELCLNKLKTFETFSDISPKTAAINSFFEYQKYIGKWEMQPEDRIVLKKNFEARGRGIVILPVSEITEDVYQDWKDVLVQEFIDSSLGIEGLVEGLHDLRVTVIDGIPINSFIRKPEEGSFLANVDLGGTGFSIDIADVPDEVFVLIDKINQQVSEYRPLIYAADFMNSPKGYKLVELNSRPGVQHPDWSNTYKKFNDAMVQMLIDAVKE